MKQKFIDFGMDVAEVSAKMSYATRLKVGAVLMKNSRIVSCGFNGTGIGEDNCCEHIVPEGHRTKPTVRHAEQNAILPMLKTSISTEDMVLMVTHAPCLPCAMLTIDAGIKSVYYKHDYRDTVGLDYLRANGVAVIKV